MNQRPKLVQHQTMRLSMTPELQLSLKILQFDRVDLAAYLAGEIADNPMMEFGDDGALSKEETLEYQGRPENPAPVDANLFTSVFTNDSSTENPSGRPEEGSGFHEAHAQPSLNAGRDLEPNFQKPETFHDHVHDQLALLPLATKSRMIANYLADSLDEAGYVSPSLKEVAEALGCAEKKVEEVLGVLQEIEPAGVFARDLKECLVLQLKDRGRYDAVAKAVLEHLDLIAKRDFDALARVCGTSEKNLDALIRVIKKLDPKPGLRFAGADPLQTLIPDIFVRHGKGGWRVELNNDALPRLLVNQQYSLALKEKTLNKNTVVYLKVCKTRVSWLKKALDQRAQTILKVSRALVEHQQSFFEKGVRFLKPLTYREMAQETGLHESTISRVVQNKYLASPRGVFKLRYFFPASLASGEDGLSTSALAVKHRVRELIDQEQPAKILSDDKIASLLKKDGITISRRTVMKYREAMRIPSSFERRQLKL